jgi:hypothetical protein
MDDVDHWPHRFLKYYFICIALLENTTTPLSFDLKKETRIKCYIITAIAISLANKYSKKKHLETDYHAVKKLTQKGLRCIFNTLLSETNKQNNFRPSTIASKLTTEKEYHLDRLKSYFFPDCKNEESTSKKIELTYTHLTEKTLKKICNQKKEFAILILEKEKYKEGKNLFSILMEINDYIINLSKKHSVLIYDEQIKTECFFKQLSKIPPLGIEKLDEIKAHLQRALHPPALERAIPWNDIIRILISCFLIQKSFTQSPAENLMRIKLLSYASKSSILMISTIFKAGKNFFDYCNSQNRLCYKNFIYSPFFSEIFFLAKEIAWHLTFSSFLTISQPH